MPHELKINAADLLEAVSQAVCKANHDTYRHALFDVSGDGVYIISTDGTVEFSQYLLHEGGELPPVALDAFTLRGVLQGLTGVVTLKLDDDLATLHHQKRRFMVPCIPGEAFPILDDMQATVLDTDFQDLLTGMRRTLYAAPTNDVRYYLNGVCVQPARVAATDGHRLAVYPLKKPMLTLDAFELIVPTHAVATALKYTSDITEIQARNDSKSNKPCAVTFKGDNFKLTAKVIDARYVPVEPLLESKPVELFTVTMHARDAINAIQRMRIYDSVAEFSSKKNTLNLEHRNGTHDALPAEITGAMPTIKMNMHYMADVLALAGDDPVVWHGAAVDTSTSVNMRKQLLTIGERNEQHILMPYN